MVGLTNSSWKPLSFTDQEVPNDAPRWRATAMQVAFDRCLSEVDEFHGQAREAKSISRT